MNPLALALLAAAAASASDPPVAAFRAPPLVHPATPAVIRAPPPAVELPLPPSEARPRDRFFGEDKGKHFFTSFAATALAAAGARAAGFEPRASLRIGVTTGAALGIGKEIHDLTRPEHTASMLDLVWDFSGVAAAAAVAAQVR
jgi:uncharacterized protein YfiM (DUF2279 family)